MSHLTYLRFGLLTLFTSLFVISCGTIVNGTTQDVSIASSPSGAEVEIDGNAVGETPITRSLDRGNQHTIELNLDDYESESLVVKKSTSGWVWGNIIFGGLIGLAVDASTGGMYKLEPTDINRSLDEKTAGLIKESDVYIGVVLQPKADWEKIGQLEETSD